MGDTFPGATADAVADAGDAQLVARAERGDREAFGELYRRHAAPAWRAALAVGGSTATAEHAVAEGFTAALRRRIAPATFGVPFRLAVVRATIEAASAEAASGVAPAADTATNDAIAALHRLPARSRAVLWLVAVEGGTPAQVAPIVGLDAAEVASLAGRAEHAVRHQATSIELDAPLRPALAPLVVPLPAGLGASAAAWWAAWHDQAERGQRRRLGAVWTAGPLTERIVGAAAATVLAAGLAAALVRDDGGGHAPAVVLPGNGEQASGAANATPATPPATTGEPPGRATATPARQRATSVLSASDPLAPVAAPTTATPTRPGGGSGGLTVPQSPVAPDAPTPPAATSDVPVVSASVLVGTTPVGVTVGGDGGAGVQVGSTVIGNPPPPPKDSSIVIDTGVLPTIKVSLP